MRDRNNAHLSFRQQKFCHVALLVQFKVEVRVILELHLLRKIPKKLLIFSSDMA